MRTTGKVVWFLVKWSFLALLWVIHAAAEEAEERYGKSQYDTDTLDTASPDSVAYHIATEQL